METKELHFCLQVNKYAKELLAAMSSGMEERDDPSKQIALEAMSGLSKVLVYLDKKNVQLLVVYIFMKIKPFLESVSSYCASISVTSCATPTFSIPEYIQYCCVFFFWFFVFIGRRMMRSVLHPSPC